MITVETARTTTMQMIENNVDQSIIEASRTGQWNVTVPVSYVPIWLQEKLLNSGFTVNSQQDGCTISWGN